MRALSDGARSWIVAGSALGLCQCVPSEVERPTAVLVVVNSDLASLASVRVEVRDPAGLMASDVGLFKVRSSAEDPATADAATDSLPFSLSVEKAPARGLDRFLLVASGFDTTDPPDDAVPVVAQRYLVAFVDHLTTRLIVHLDQVCQGIVCDAQSSCYAGDVAGAEVGVCIPVVAVATLPTVVPGHELDGLGRQHVDIAVDADAQVAELTDAGAVPAVDASNSHARADARAAEDAEGPPLMPPTADDGVDDCLGNACQHGGRCIDDVRTYRCDCAGTGYAAPLCATEDDVCAASGTCAPEYACESTAPPGFTCRGQLADWPMPDSIAGAHTAPAYEVGAQGTVTDLVTGLMWEQSPDTDKRAFYDASARCTTLTTAGFRDWRVPSKIELESLVDHTPFNPSIDGTRFFNTVGDYYWTSSPQAGTIGFSYYWTVSFYNGFTFAFEANAPKLVRCVRSPVPVASGAPATRFVADEAADTMTDRRTELVWQRSASAEAMGWEEAKALCSARGAGYRLPTAKELLTLVDPTRSEPCIHAAFPPPPSKGFWSATPNHGSDGKYDGRYYGVYFSDGHTSFATPSLAYYVRCVR